MKVLFIILSLLIGPFLMACHHKKDGKDDEQYEVVNIGFTEEEESPEPPPPGVTSRFKTLEEWLYTICNKEKPKKPIAIYQFSLFEGEDRYTLCLTGTNTYEKSQYHTQTLIDFAPANMYFVLPINEYKGLKHEEVLARLTTQLKAFTNTAQFKQSFFQEAKSITTDWKGAIWSK